MRVSDFIALVGRLVHLNITTLIAVTIASIILGAVTHRAASSIQSVITLTVASLLALMIWFRLWETGEALWRMLFTVSIAVVGHILWILYITSRGP